AGIIHNRVRALNPWPVARTRLGGEKSLKVYRTAPVLESDQDNALPLAAPADAPGDFTVSRSGSQKRLFVRCGDARLLEILELQPENRKKLTSGEFLNGYQKDSGRFE
ncbi:MAG: hypothetical protein KDK27_07650, partial [Leptospiraceae bacterium]|nr:hypothetical protein [Leptospiraceae bacterium]